MVQGEILEAIKNSPGRTIGDYIHLIIFMGGRMRLKTATVPPTKILTFAADSLGYSTP